MCYFWGPAVNFCPRSHTSSDAEPCVRSPLQSGEVISSTKVFVYLEGTGKTMKQLKYDHLDQLTNKSSQTALHMHLYFFIIQPNVALFDL